jgi:threonine dehydrogenase-like Zn-dependent dehydrogenase
VLVPFNIACGQCHFCKQGLYGNCHENNPQATAVGAIYGYSHTGGGFDGGQAQYVRVPYADFGPSLIPDWMDPDDAVLLTDVVPTGYQAAEMGGIQRGDTVLVLGAGPVGLLAARSAWLFGAGRVIVLDHIDYRLEFARSYCPAEVYNFKELDDVVVFMKKTTDGLGVDVAIDAVGGDAKGNFSRPCSAPSSSWRPATPSPPTGRSTRSRKAASCRSSASTGRPAIWSRSATS